MEDELDLLSSQPSEQAMECWHQICKRCLNDITEKSKPLAKQTKQTFALSDTADYVLVFNSYGASLKGIGEDGKTEYLKVRADMDLDIEKATRGEYTMSELVWREDNGCLGKYNDTPIYMKKGKFGLYAEWGGTGSSKNTISLKPLNLSAEEIRLKDVVTLIEKKSNTLTQEEAAAMFLPQCVLGEEEEKYNIVDNALEPTKQTPSDKTLLRTLRSDLSIRKGKYGPYIFHKTEKMSTPKFYPLKPFKDDWKTMSNLELIAAIDRMYIAKK